LNSIELMTKQSEKSSSPFRLIVSRGELKGKVFLIEPGQNLIGRWDPDAGAFPEIDLTNEDVDAKVSRKHALIVCENARVTIEDCGSLNGTFVNRGARLEANQKHELKSGDEIIVGKTFVRFEVE
jgi:pSer/pThr/pTyr-binding forkhead associated (FHA) protein